MAKETSNKNWPFWGVVVFVSLNYAVLLDWSDGIDRRLSALENKSGTEPIIERKTERLDEELIAASDSNPDRYLCTSNNIAYFTYNPDQQNCRIDKLPNGWANLFFSKDQMFDYYKDGLSRTGNEVRVWARMLFNLPQTKPIQQVNGTQSKIEFNELKSFLIFTCPTMEYKNTNIVYVLNGKKILETTGNRAHITSYGLTSYSLNDEIEPIEPGTFVDTLYKAVCFKE